MFAAVEITKVINKIFCPHEINRNCNYWQTSAIPRQFWRKFSKAKHIYQIYFIDDLT